MQSDNAARLSSTAAVSRLDTTLSSDLWNSAFQSSRARRVRLR